MYFEEKPNYSYYLNKPIGNVFNVGWLDKNNEYSRGAIDSRILDKLAEILVLKGNANVHVNWARSLDPCELSGCTGLKVVSSNKEVDLGGSEIWLPSSERQYYFASPSLIYHYIHQHDYLPPCEFIKAVDEFDIEESYTAQDVGDVPSLVNFR